MKNYEKEVRLLKSKIKQLRKEIERWEEKYCGLEYDYRQLKSKIKKLN